MAIVQLVAVPCQLSPGVFSSERVFEVVLKNGERHQGVAPRFFCWNERGQVVAEDEPADLIDGMVAAKLLDRGSSDYAVVEVPDGEVIAVEKSAVRKRPTEIVPPGEKPSHVFVGS